MAPLRNYDREQQILDQLKDGRPVRYVAKHFGVSEQHIRTVLLRYEQPPPRTMAAIAAAAAVDITLAPSNNITPYRIETGVPLPAAPSLYPLEEMDVGASFLIPCDIYKRRAKKKNLDALLHRHHTKKHKRWRSAQVKEGVRVWRVK